jgi:HSP20 family protein
MSNLTRRTNNDLSSWDPFREMDDFSSRLSRFFGREPLASSGLSDWTPRANVHETSAGYEIQAELPQVKREDVNVTVENGVLTISGERRYERKEDGNGNTNKVHRIETAYGSFVRSFSLPDDADASKIDAKYDNGMLEVKVARMAGRTPSGTRTIPIK